MSLERLQRYLRTPLLVFVLVSVGFAWGRLSAPVGGAGDPAAVGATRGEDTRGEDTRVVVRYFHGDIRCVTCNDIEAALERTLAQRYAAAVDAGSIVYEEINFDHEATLAQRYDVATSMPVVAYEIDGREAGAETLVAVWEKLGDERELEAFLVAAIDRASQAAGLGDLKAEAP